MHSDTMAVPLLSSSSFSRIALISSLFSVQSQRSRERRVRSLIVDLKINRLTTIFITATACTWYKPEKRKEKDPAYARGWGAQGTCYSSKALLSRSPCFSFSVAKLLSRSKRRSCPTRREGKKTGRPTLFHLPLPLLFPHRITLASRVPTKRVKGVLDRPAAVRFLMARRSSCAVPCGGEHLQRYQDTIEGSVPMKAHEKKAGRILCH
jgi:hypothetical protein